MEWIRNKRSSRLLSQKILSLNIVFLIASGVLFWGLIQTSYSVVSSFSISAGNVKNLPISLTTGQRVTGSLAISGGSDDIDFWVENPSGTQIILEDRVFNGHNFSFVATTSGSYTLFLDNTISTFTTKTVTVTYSISPPPVANAGSDQIIDEGSLVILDGASSTDTNDDSLTYLWSQTSGVDVTLSSTSIANPTFTAPSVTADTVLQFQLTVSNSDLLTSTDTVDITILDSKPSFTFVQSGIGKLTKSLAGFSKGAYNIQVSISTDYEFNDEIGSLSVTIISPEGLSIDSNSLSGTLVIDDTPFDLKIKKLTITDNFKTISYKAKLDGVTGSVSGTLKFKTPINFQNEQTLEATGKNILNVLKGKADFLIKKPSGSISFT